MLVVLPLRQIESNEKTNFLFYVYSCCTWKNYSITHFQLQGRFHTCVACFCILLAYICQGYFNFKDIYFYRVNCTGSAHTVVARQSNTAVQLLTQRQSSLRRSNMHRNVKFTDTQNPTVIQFCVKPPRSALNVTPPAFYIYLLSAVCCWAPALAARRSQLGARSYR